MIKLIEELQVNELSIIPTDKGDVLHALKESDDSFFGFGELYFSEINQGVIKGWKRHKEMTMNLMVPSGEVKIVVYDGRLASLTRGIFNKFIISRHKNYQRLSVPPGVSIAFQGIAKGTSQVMNFSNIMHDPNEVENIDLDEIKYNWELS